MRLRLGARRAAAFVLLAAALAVYFAVHTSLPNLSLGWDVAALSFLILPAVFATVLLLLPLCRGPGRLSVGVGLGLVALAAVFTAVRWDALASFAKLGAATFVAWAFLDLFEALSWVVLVAVIIPWVDAFSVFRGPTKHIVTHHRGIFGDLSFAFPVPGQHSTANLGIPDLFFFALFLAATVRWSLRPATTWVLMTASFGVTIALAIWWNPTNLRGLPALPLLSLAFFVANADLLWLGLRNGDDQNPGVGTGQNQPS